MGTPELPSCRLGWLKQRRSPRPLVKGTMWCPRRAQEVRFIESQGRWALPAHGQQLLTDRCVTGSAGPGGQCCPHEPQSVNSCEGLSPGRKD